MCCVLRAGDLDDPPPAKKGRGPGRPPKSSLDGPGPPITAPPPDGNQTTAEALAALVATREERKAVRHAVMSRNIDAKLVSRKCVVLQPALQAALRLTREKTGTEEVVPKKARRKSTYRGVEPSGAAGWSAELIAKGGKRHYLGTYRTEEEAARAFDKKALELRGDKARLNFPPEGQGVKPPTDPEATATDFLGVYRQNGVRSPSLMQDAAGSRGRVQRLQPGHRDAGILRDGARGCPRVRRGRRSSRAAHKRSDVGAD